MMVNVYELPSSIRQLELSTFLQFCVSMAHVRTYNVHVQCHVCVLVCMMYMYVYMYVIIIACSCILFVTMLNIIP